MQNVMDSGTPERIGEINRKLILDCVRKNGPISRADLHRTLNMSFPTISTNVKKLLQSGYLVEAGDGDNNLGRKSTLLQFNAERAYVVGVDVGRSQLRVILADLDGNEAIYLNEPYAASEDDSLRTTLNQLIAQAIARAGITPEKVLYIAVGIPGIADMKTGRLIAAPFIRMPNLKQIEESLRAAYPNADILFENSVNFGAVAEKWKGAAHNFRDIVYISYGVGIGAAVILNGELYHGRNGASGEIGYMVPGVENMRENNESQGVLESMISGRHIGELLKARGTDVFPGLSLEEALQDDVLRRIADLTAIALINLTAVIDEEVIIVGGGLGGFLGQLFIPYWKELLGRHLPYVPEILCSGLTGRAGAMGAVAVAIRKVNDNEINLQSESFHAE